MASSGGIRVFYRQRKKAATIAGGVAKPSAASSKKQVTGAVKVPTPAQQIHHGSIDLSGSEEEYGPEETALRQFDMDMRYGPCLGMSRMERWQRAARLGLHPPPEVADLLLRRQEPGGGGAAAVNLECLLDGRI
ncbi:hypothetical protein Taro_031565 [Colocasia esculenta]|uniref:DNA polymerase delta subunit 4 n=1 Tax=Colocasia esculenta TaxID=4460 RepID=A0A843VQC2_COLES|nr:hypothetical protein [Colocasia esculenta]